MFEDIQKGMQVDVKLKVGGTMRSKRVENIQTVLDKKYFTFKTRDKWAKILGNGAYGEDRIVSMTIREKGTSPGAPRAG